MPESAETIPLAAICNCLALRQATRQITQLYDEELAAVDLRVTQYSLLSVLDRHGPTTLNELARALVMDRSTLGHNLRPLERAGLVSLAFDPEDKRARRLALSARGRTKLKAARPHWQRAQARFEHSFGAADAGALRASLRKVVESAGA
ncbi:MAG: MarR family winged helix-turn-helix transcriptional regulator [Polyangiaceae bacterium]